MLNREDVEYIRNNLVRMIEDGNSIQYQLNSLEIRINDYLGKESSFDLEIIQDRFMKLKNLLQQLDADSNVIIDILESKE